MSHLPPDPDGQNDNRADSAESALVLFRQKTGLDTEGDKEAALRDLLANLMHWCDRYGQDFDYELVQGRNHYVAEITELETG